MYRIWIRGFLIGIPWIKIHQIPHYIWNPAQSLNMKVKLTAALLCRQIFEWWWQSWYIKLWERRILWNAFLYSAELVPFWKPRFFKLFDTRRQNKNNFVLVALSCSYLSSFLLDFYFCVQARLLTNSCDLSDVLKWEMCLRDWLLL